MVFPQPRIIPGHSDTPGRGYPCGGHTVNATAKISSFTSHPDAYDATKTRCSFMNAAFVRISGRGPISQIAAASPQLLHAEPWVSSAAASANTAQLTNGSGLVNAIPFSSAPLRQLSG